MAAQLAQLAATLPDGAPERALCLQGEAQALSLLSGRLWRGGDLAGAEAALDRALALAPSRARRIRRALLLPAVPDSRAAILDARTALIDRLIALAGDQGPAIDAAEIGWTLFLLAYHAELDNRDLYRLFHLIAAQADPALPWTAPLVRAPRRGGRPRIGILSWHFVPHTIAHLFGGLREALDGRRFEITILGFEGRTAALEDLDLAGKRVLALPAALPEARRQVAALELDLLLYLDLGMDFLTLFLAQARLARTQAVTWGHPDSTGLDSIDVFLSPDCMEPENGASQYCERLVRLPGLLAVYPRPAPPRPGKSRAALGLPDQGFLYLCPQTPYKFHPDFDTALIRILRGVEGSHLILTAGWEQAAMRRVAGRLLAQAPDLAPRLHILGPLPRADFLTLFQHAGLVLDPFHYSGGNTSLEAFACGSPILTWPGASMRARHTAGFYRLMEIKELIARDHDHYIEQAIHLGTTPNRLEELRGEILKRNAVLFNNHDSIPAFEDFIMDCL